MTSYTYIIVTDAVPAAAAAGLPIDVAVFVVDADAPDLLFHPSSVLFKEISAVRVRALLQLRGRLRIPRPGKKGRTAEEEAIKIRGPRERDREGGADRT